MKTLTSANRLLAVLLGAFLLSVGSVVSAQDVLQPDPWCPSIVPPTIPAGFDRVFEPAIKAALDNEILTINLVADIPGPLPGPTRNQIDRIADLFNRVALETITARTFASVASLPGPLPSPDQNSYRKALTALDSAHHFLGQLEKSINEASRKGLVDENTYLFLQAMREELVADLPVPTP